MEARRTELEQSISSWLEKIWKISFPFDLFDTIPDGSLLCKTVKKLRPDLAIEFAEARTRDLSMKNAQSFVQACAAVGLNGNFLFEPSDLVDHKDELKVLKTLLALVILLARDNSSIPSLPDCDPNEVLRLIGYPEEKPKAAEPPSFPPAPKVKLQGPAQADLLKPEAPKGEPPKFPPPPKVELQKPTPVEPPKGEPPKFPPPPKVELQKPAPSPPILPELPKGEPPKFPLPPKVEMHIPAPVEPPKGEPPKFPPPPKAELQRPSSQPLPEPPKGEPPKGPLPKFPQIQKPEPLRSASLPPPDSPTSEMTPKPPVFGKPLASKLAPPPIAINTKVEEDEEEEEEPDLEAIDLGLNDTKLGEEDIAYLMSMVDSLQESYSQIAKKGQADSLKIEDIFRSMEEKSNRIDELFGRTQNYVAVFSESFDHMGRSRVDMISQAERIAKMEKVADSGLSSRTAPETRGRFPPLEARKSTKRMLSTRRSVIKRNTIYEEGSPSLTGTLHVSVISATGIKACDATGFSDPYCIIRVGKENKLEKVARTETILQTLNPTWNETFKLHVKNVTTLGIRCKDWDRFSQDDTCGDVYLDLLLHFNQERKDEKPFTLQFDTQGSIDIRVKFEPIDK